MELRVETSNIHPFQSFSAFNVTLIALRARLKPCHRTLDFGIFGGGTIGSGAQGSWHISCVHCASDELLISYCSRVASL